MKAVQLFPEAKILRVYYAAFAYYRIIAFTENHSFWEENKSSTLVFTTDINEHLSLHHLTGFKLKWLSSMEYSQDLSSIDLSARNLVGNSNLNGGTIRIQAHDMRVNHAPEVENCIRLDQWSWDVLPVVVRASSLSRPTDFRDSSSPHRLRVNVSCGEAWNRGEGV